MNRSNGMSHEFIEKKLEQVRVLLGELDTLLKKPFDAFEKEFVTVRAAERNFQLIVDLASDCNTHILMELGHKTPDSYRQSFIELEKVGVLPRELTRILAESARLRNILVHEYDFEEDYKKFYDSAKEFSPAYRAYIRVLGAFLEKEQEI
ncbi:MAG: hypothetical protein G01um101429_1049 [Parcubacteria group bacterium Gr01-1014_29]|nr:MAG: hypothetical protein G01um101429_1049 [Parcubacteria group bacterium Gr01-1014_29]